ncbi:MAG: MBL fold metallo-hydrolase [Planctomycetota bacterium]|nr:MAG: MBL fold metallo-hydrolase [Planctomycetota bacterium]
MILQQFYLPCLSHASYVVADETTRAAFVVDPQRDVERYLEFARERGLSIEGVILTHFHADFVSGHLELAARVGARIYIGARARPDFAHEPLADRARIERGALSITALETPGHTPEGICLLVADAGAPRALLTGDTLFIGDVGRPDLMASRGVSADQLARALWKSLRTQIAPLPDDVVVYPAHGAGSACGKNMSKELSATLGAQRAVNWALRATDEESFVRELTQDQPSAPAYFGYDAALNRAQRPTLEQSLEKSLAPLPLARVLELTAPGAAPERALVLDTREPDEYAAGHLVGSLNIGLSGKYASWAGALVAPQQPLVLLCAPGRERESALRLGRIGYDRVIGVLDGGFGALTARPDLVRRTERRDAAAFELERRLPGSAVLDVRERGERPAGSIANSLHIPLGELARRAHELPRDRRLLVHCAGGYRSMIAASVMEAAGLTNVADLSGGFGAWKAAGLPVEVGAA